MAKYPQAKLTHASIIRVSLGIEMKSGGTYHQQECAVCSFDRTSRRICDVQMDFCIVFEVFITTEWSAFMLASNTLACVGAKD